jgi:hypothetical protein
MAKTKVDRPVLPTAILEGISNPGEAFQNEVLRPLVKMQSDLLMAHIKAKLQGLKIDWEALGPIQQKEALTTLFSKDQSFKSEIVGMVIGQFDLQEYQKYLALQKDMNRRISQIVLNRAVDLLTTS